MTDTPDATPPSGAAADETAPYDVVVLVEQELTAGDAERITALHRGITEETGAEVRYHLLLPVDDPADRRTADECRDGVHRWAPGHGHARVLLTDR